MAATNRLLSEKLQIEETNHLAFTDELSLLQADAEKEMELIVAESKDREKELNNRIQSLLASGSASVQLPSQIAIRDREAALLKRIEFLEQALEQEKTAVQVMNNLCGSGRRKLKPQRAALPRCLVPSGTA